MAKSIIVNPTSMPLASIKRSELLYGAKIDEQRTGFLDLPPELRNRVYEMVFSCPRQAHLKPARRTGGVSHEGRLKVHSNILLTAKLIRDEFGPILYGSTQFCFTTQHVFHNFLLRAHASGFIKHIRHLKIGFHRSLAREATFPGEAESLQELCVTGTFVLPGPESAFEILRPVIRALNESKRKDGKSAADIIRFGIMWMDKQSVIKAKELTAEVRRLIRESMA